jgi:hypothetical protein
MGMTIDNLELLAKGLDCMGDAEHAKDIRQAIEIMHRYQKIEGIVNNWHHDIEAKDFECMAEIADVVENGNDK